MAGAGGKGDLLLALGSIGGSGLGAALAPEPFQRKKSFDNTGADPTDWLTDIRNILSRNIGQAEQRANTPLDLSHLAPSGPLPSYSGGGLPMPIGVSNLVDLTQSSDTKSHVPSPWDDVYTGGGKSGVQSMPMSNGPQRKPYGAAMATPDISGSGQGDDFESARAAATLLAHAFGPMGGPQKKQPAYA